MTFNSGLQIPGGWFCGDGLLLGVSFSQINLVDHNSKSVRITFRSNRAIFPTSINVFVESNDTALGEHIVQEIQRIGDEQLGNVLLRASETPRVGVRSKKSADGLAAEISSV